MAVFTVYSWGAILLLFCVLFKHLPTTRALKYNVIDKSPAREWIFVDGSYGFMYGIDKGPWPYKKGPSYALLNFSVVVNESEFMNSKVRVGFTKLITSSENGQLKYVPPDLCPISIGQDNYVPNNSRLYEIDFDGNGPHVANISIKFDVHYPMPLLTFIQLCTDESTPDTAVLTGSASFENPYGYLPGTMYPFLPLYFGIFLILGVAFSLFTYLLVRHRETSLPLHFGSWIVLLIGILDALIWFWGLQYINRTGTPLCCPSPDILVFALTLEVVLHAVFRCLTLCVCLGYGIVHPKLTKLQTFFVIFLTALFIVTGLYSTWYRTLSNGSMQKKNAATVPAFLVDSAFMVWIYISLNLRIFRKRLKMYQHLTSTVMVALCCYVSFTILLIVSMITEPIWLWHWIWIVNAAQEIISTCMLIAVCIIWRPSSTSNMLSWSKQVPLNEDDVSDGYSWGSDDDDGVEEFEVEMGRAFAILGEDDDASAIDIDYNDIHVDSSMDRLDHNDSHHTKLSPKT